MEMQEGPVQDYFEMNDGDVRIWIEQGSSIHMKVVTKENDPVELSGYEALRVADILRGFSGRIK
ncbi:hypothetical protein [Pseudomonas purpurea]|uniref:hypothetical protein n=1 Tax=Pseudomonas purpurea TaxID=3136737 RepID=UPI003264B381